MDYKYEPEKLNWQRRVVNGICDACSGRKVHQLRKYIPDFVLANGIRLEVKGRLTPSDRVKMESIRRNYPEMDIRIVFGANNKVTKTKERRYTDWATETGLISTIKMLPDHWKESFLKEKS